MVLAAHQRQFDLVLHVLDVEGAAFAHRRVSALTTCCGQLLDDLMHAARGGRGLALDGEERLGHGDRDLAGIECRDRAVAADDLHR